MVKYKDKIVFESNLNLSLINRTAKAKKQVQHIKSKMRNDDIWVIKTLTTRVDYRNIVDYLFKFGLDVFDIEYGPIIKIYVCLMDSYRITNRVVFSVRGT